MVLLTLSQMHKENLSESNYFYVFSEGSFMENILFVVIGILLTMIIMLIILFLCYYKRKPSTATSLSNIHQLSSEKNKSNPQATFKKTNEYELESVDGKVRIFNEVNIETKLTYIMMLFRLALLGKFQLILKILV